MLTVFTTHFNFATYKIIFVKRAVFTALALTAELLV